jgi:hypothetical protein
VPAGTVTPLENVNGRKARRSMETRKKRITSRTWDTGEEIKRTVADTINPLGLPEETVDLVHLVHSDFRPTFLSNHSVDLLAEGFNIFRICKKTVQHLRERLYYHAVIRIVS